MDVARPGVPIRGAESSSTSVSSSSSYPLATDGGGASSDEPWEQRAPLVNLRRALSAGSAAEGSGGDAGV